MGMDGLDLAMRFERTFALKKFDWDELIGSLPDRSAKDLTVAQLYGYIRRKATAHVVDGIIAADMICPACKANWRGVPLAGYCPMCILAISGGSEFWGAFRRLMAGMFGVEPDDVLPGNWLVRDLNFS